MRKVLLLNGPNLNLLGTREPGVYGARTLDDIVAELHDYAGELSLELDARQSNHEGHLIDWLQEAPGTGVQAVIMEAGGFTPASGALRDAVAAIATPVIEVNLGNLAAREPYRQHSMIAALCAGSISGFGALSYRLALDAAARL